ncbi:MAG: hypothetical protein WBV71_19920 [Roseobacter sp.]
MSRKFIAIVASAALLITAVGNAPARADEDLARLLATVVGVAIVGAVISNKLDDDKDKDDRVSRRSTDRDGITRQATPRGDVIRRAETGAFPRRTNRQLLPGACLQSFDTRDGRYRVFGKKCLQQNYRFTSDLPRACKVKFRANGKKRNGYGARCLRRSGYQLARR